MIRISSKIVFVLVMLATAANARPKDLKCEGPNTIPAPPRETPYCEKGGWTGWYDNDDPMNGNSFSEQCDIENFGQIRARHSEICKNPSAVDVKIIGGASHLLAWNIIVNLNEVKCCHDHNQISSNACLVCHDYAVRYCCPATVGKCDVGPTIASVAWTGWQSVDDPNTGGDDLEVVTGNMLGNIQLCSNRIAIEARVKSTGLPYVSGGDVLSYVNAAQGLKCPLGNTECKDYEVRFCCAKKRKTVDTHQQLYQHHVLP